MYSCPAGDTVTEAPQTEVGLPRIFKQVLQTLSQLVGSRVELFLVELKEERVRLFTALALVLAGALFALMTVELVTLLIVVAFWDTDRIPVLVALILVYACAAAGAFFTLRRQLRQWQSFGHSLEQLKKDRECLETES